MHCKRERSLGLEACRSRSDIKSGVPPGEQAARRPAPTVNVNGVIIVEDETGRDTARDFGDELPDTGHAPVGAIAGGDVGAVEGE